MLPVDLHIESFCETEYINTATKQRNKMWRENKNAINVIKILPAQNANSFSCFYHTNTNKIY